MRDLNESLSVEDCHDLLEIAMVKVHNRRLMNKSKE